ncbi:hypothetical protein Tco_0609042 [Tanacetum coccineum]
MTGSENPPVILLSDKLSTVTHHHHLLTHVPVKLDIDNWNYTFWMYFFKNLCKGYEVLKYILGLSSEATMSTTLLLNPEEVKVDTIVLSWILMILSDTLQACLVVEDPQTAKEAWDLIAKILNDNKCSQTIALKAELRSLGLGLPQKYENVSGIITHPEPFPDLKTARSMLTTEEMRLKSKSQALPVASSSLSPMVFWPIQSMRAKSSNNSLWSSSSNSGGSTTNGNNTNELLAQLLSQLGITGNKTLVVSDFRQRRIFGDHKDNDATISTSV